MQAKLLASWLALALFLLAGCSGKRTTVLYRIEHPLGREHATVRVMKIGSRGAGPSRLDSGSVESVDLLAFGPPLRSYAGIHVTRVWGGWSKDGEKLSLLLCGALDPHLLIEHVASPRLMDPYPAGAADFLESDAELSASLRSTFAKFPGFPVDGDLGYQAFWFCNGPSGVHFEEVVKSGKARVWVSEE